MNKWLNNSCLDSCFLDFNGERERSFNLQMLAVCSRGLMFIGDFWSAPMDRVFVVLGCPGSLNVSLSFGSFEWRF